MATMSSGGHPGVLLGGTSSFGQFRLTTFVDSNPKPKASSASQTTSSNVGAEPSSLVAENGSAMSSSHVLESFSEKLQSSSSTLESTSSNAIASGAPAGDAASTSHNGFGVLDLAPTPAAREGKLGPHRDGRVRNPIPRKLKGKTNAKSGNFAVMHMDMSGSGPNDIPRGEAAKRTSENTAEAARTANSAGYVPVKRRRVEAPVAAPPEDANGTSSRFFPDLPQQEPVRRSRFLTATETKYEQARLLTLLRSIAPLLVVDQICKALAFFGGIPGAPPPGDGIFPASAESNGSGALFVGWLSEIFPELERKGWNPETTKPSQEPVRVKRPRGRPKGSKATKVRKDKGIKKGPKYSGNDEGRGLPAPLVRLRPATSQDDSVNVEDEDWIDVTGIDEDFNDVDQRNTIPLEQDGEEGGSSDTLMDANPMNMNHNRQYLSTADMERRRPGRPKGSRNRTRDSEIGMNLEPGFTSSDLVTSDTQSLVTADSATPVKRKRGRPPLNKSASQDLSGSVAPPTSGAASVSIPAVKAHPAQAPAAAELPRPAAVPVVGLSAEEQAVLEAFRTARAAQVTHVTAEKRKRGPRKSAATAPRAPEDTSLSAGLIQVPVIDPVVSTPLITAPIQPDPIAQPTPKESPAILPPPKRQRKPKDSNTPAPAKKAVVKAVATTSAPPSNTISQSAPITTETSIPPRPAPQGLEAHYEHFASLQQQQQQQQQQQVQQQVQQQHDRQQKARLDQTSISRSSPLQTSSSTQSSSMQSNSPFSFHQPQQQQQPRHIPSTYGQQYPSHQPSNPYQQSTLSVSSQADSFRSINQPHTQAHYTPAPRQNQQQQQSSHQNQNSHHSTFNQNHSHSHFPDSASLGNSFIDPLESVTNVNGGGGPSVNAYGGAGISRSASGGSYGAGVGAQMGGFELSDNDLRDRLLRGIGRR